MSTTPQANISNLEYNSCPAKLKTNGISASTRRLNQITADLAQGHRQSMRRAWRFFARQVIAPRLEQYPTESCRHSIALLAAQQLARAAITGKRKRAGYNPMNLAHDMAVMANAAPDDTPCALDRLGFERIVLDMLNLAHKQRGAK